MSYCRWSSDDFGCDLYCYEDVNGGWTTHVARNRVIGEVPPMPDLLSTKPDEFLASYRAQVAFLERADRKPIGLPFDGHSFNDPDLPSFKARLLELRAAGYRFPDSVLVAVDQEIAETAN